MQEKLLKALEQIKLGKKKLEDFNFSLKDYLSKDNSGFTFLEYILMNNLNIGHFEEKKLNKSIEVAQIYLRYNKSIWGFEFKEEEFFSRINQEMFVETLIKNNELASDMLSSIKNHIEIVDMLVKYDKIHIIG